jgi:hypothetical protein
VFVLCGDLVTEIAELQQTERPSVLRQTAAEIVRSRRMVLGGKPYSADVRFRVANARCGGGRGRSRGLRPRAPLGFG